VNNTVALVSSKPGARKRPGLRRVSRVALLAAALCCIAAVAFVAYGVLAGTGSPAPAPGAPITGGAAGPSIALGSPGSTGTLRLNVSSPSGGSG